MNNIKKYLMLTVVVLFALILLIKLLPEFMFMVSVGLFFGLLYALNEINAGRKTVDDFKVIVESWIQKIKQFLN